MMIVIEILIGYFIADFLSGLFHYIEDVHLIPERTEGIPFIHSLALDNKLHHLKPRKLVERPWYETISTTIPFAIACGLVFYYFFGWMSWWITAVSLGIFLNQVHKWQHMTYAERPIVVSFLMNAGLLASAKHHAIHHIPPFNKNFCVLSPHLNNIVNFIYM